MIAVPHPFTISHPPQVVEVPAGDSTHELSTLVSRPTQTQYSLVRQVWICQRSPVEEVRHSGVLSLRRAQYLSMRSWISSCFAAPPDLKQSLGEETPDVAEGAGAAELPDPVEMPDVAEATGATELPDPVEMPDVVETPDAAEMLDAVEKINVVEMSDVAA
ncbi:hypothetical protein BD779DRAFT_1528151 [Infundibulicybe gibba]|nr:hypothetical protein BD779DRAFT_1528151 [Infundibulicybe gibba]